MNRARPNSGHRRRFPAFFYKLTFTNKILVSTLALMLLLGGAGAIFLRNALRSRLCDEVASSTRMLARNAASQASQILASGNTDALATLVGQVLSLDGDIAYVLVVDRHGKVVAHSFAWDPPAEVTAARSVPSSLGNNGYRRMTLDGHEYVDVDAPIRVGSAGVGRVQLGVDMNRVDGFVHELSLMFLLGLAGFALPGMMLARLFFRHVTRPIVELTHLADEVSAGRFDVRFDFGVPVRCWEIKRCGRDDCTAYGNTAVQCWYVDGTPCEGYEPRFPQKIVGCRTCEVYRTHKGDEIVQLADAFRHMTHELRTSQSDLEGSDRFLRGLIRNSFDGIIATDKSDTVQVFNRVAQHLTGHSESEVVGIKTWDQFFDPDVSKALRLPLFQDGARVIFGFYRREMAIYRKDGSMVAVRASGITLRDGQLNAGKVFFFQDMRELKKLREDLIRSERLAATGQTVASISHAVKNILEGLRGGAYIYKRGVRIRDPGARSEGWSMVERNIDLISALVADLLNFARDRQPDLQSGRFNELVTDVLASLEGKAQALDVETRTELDPAADPSDFDPHLMHQCLTNLVTNAIDAAADMEPGRVLVTTAVPHEGTLEIRVIDNGPGVAPQVVKELFSGMVSTKGSKGTGLGLLVVHKVVLEHSGSVELEARDEPGACFLIRLPRYGATPAPQIANGSGDPNRPETLVVGDNRT